AQAPQAVEEQHGGADQRGRLHGSSLTAAKAASTGMAAAAPGKRPWRLAAASAAAPAPSAPSNQPTTVGPDPATNARSAPAMRTAWSVSSISGHNERAAGSRSLTVSSAGHSGPAASASRTA